jgi:hypothetical protein
MTREWIEENLRTVQKPLIERDLYATMVKEGKFKKLLKKVRNKKTGEIKTVKIVPEEYYAEFCKRVNKELDECRLLILEEIEG